MKAWIISDIYAAPLDWYRHRVAVPNADICLLAGDISGNIYSSIDYVSAEIGARMPVVAVLGNHDYYGSSIDKGLEVARQQLGGTNVHLLENDTVIVNGIRFVGATLWTDFEVIHGTPGGIELPVDGRRDLAVHCSVRDIMDFRAIYRSDERREGETGLITIQEMVRRHGESRKYIDDELAKPFDGKSVVITHHAPSPLSFHPAYAGSPTNGAFASDLTELIMLRRPWVWVHGHIHHLSDYGIGDTRILCNPRGYVHERNFIDFRPGYVIDL